MSEQWPDRIELCDRAYKHVTLQPLADDGFTEIGHAHTKYVTENVDYYSRQSSNDGSVIYRNVMSGRLFKVANHKEYEVRDQPGPCSDDMGT